MKALVSPIARGPLAHGPVLPGRCLYRRKPSVVRRRLWVTHAAAEAELGTLHTVQTGETLAQIALAYGVSVEQIQEALPRSSRGRHAMLRSDTYLMPGQKLYVSSDGRRSGAASSVVASGPGVAAAEGAQVWQVAPLVAACLSGALLAAGAFQIFTSRKAAAATAAAGAGAGALPAPPTAAPVATAAAAAAGVASVPAATAPPAPVQSAVSEVRALLQDAAVEIQAVESALASLRRAAAAAASGNSGADAAAASVAAVAAPTQAVEAVGPGPVFALATQPEPLLSPAAAAMAVAKTPVEIALAEGGPDAAPAPGPSPVLATSGAPLEPVAAAAIGDAAVAAAANMAAEASSPGDPQTDAAALSTATATVEVTTQPEARPGVESPWTAFDTAAQVAAARARVQSALDAAYGLMLTVPVHSEGAAPEAPAADAAAVTGTAAVPSAPAVVAPAFEAEALPLVTAEALSEVARPMDAVSAGQVLDRIRSINKLLEEQQRAAVQVEARSAAMVAEEVVSVEQTPAVAITEQPPAEAVVEQPPAVAVVEQPLAEAVVEQLLAEAVAEQLPAEAVVEPPPAEAAEEPPAGLSASVDIAVTDAVIMDAVFTEAIVTAADAGASPAAPSAEAPAVVEVAEAEPVVEILEPEVEYDAAAAAAEGTAELVSDRARAAGLLEKIDVLLASFEALSSDDEAALAAMLKSPPPPPQAPSASASVSASAVPEAAVPLAAAEKAAAATDADATAPPPMISELLPPLPPETAAAASAATAADLSALDRVDSSTTTKLVLRLPQMLGAPLPLPPPSSAPEAALPVAEAVPLAPEAMPLAPEAVPLAPAAAPPAAELAPPAAAGGITASAAAAAAEALEAVVQPLGPKVANEVLDRIRDIGRLLDEEQQKSQTKAEPATAAVAWHAGSKEGAAAQPPAEALGDALGALSSSAGAVAADIGAAAADIGAAAAGVGAAAAAVVSGAAASPGDFVEKLTRVAEAAALTPEQRQNLERLRQLLLQQQPQAGAAARGLPAAKGSAGLLTAPPHRPALPPVPAAAAMEPAAAEVTIGPNWTMTPPAPGQDTSSAASSPDLESPPPVADEPVAAPQLLATDVLVTAAAPLPAADAHVVAAAPFQAVDAPVAKMAPLAAASLAAMEAPPPLPVVDVTAAGARPAVDAPVLQARNAGPTPPAAPASPPPPTPMPSSPPPPPVSAGPAPSPSPPSPPPVSPPPQPPGVSPVFQRAAEAAMAATAASAAASASAASAAAMPPPPASGGGGDGGGFADAADDTLVHLKSSLLDLVYGTARGVTATVAQRAAIEELVEALERRNPNTMATEAVSALGGRWKLVYTSNVATLMLLGALDGMPLVDVGDVVQIIDPNTLTATNKIDLAVPLLVSLRAEAGLEVRSPRQFKVRFTRVGLDTYVATPQLVAALEVPDSISLLGATLDLTPLRRLLEPINSGLEAAQDLLGRAVAPEISVDSVPVPPGLTRGSVNDAASLWMLTTYLDDTLRISRDDEGRVFVMLKDVGIYPVDTAWPGSPR